MKSALKVTVDKIWKHGEYEIWKVTDGFGNWNYNLMYKGVFRKRSFDFGYLKDIALSGKTYLMN